MATALPLEENGENSRSPYDILIDMFPTTSEEAILNIISIIETETPNDSKELQLYNMINMLTPDGEFPFDDARATREIFLDQKPKSASELEEATFLSEAMVQIGLHPSGSDAEVAVLFNNLSQTFPDACPNYISDLIAKSRYPNLDDLIMEITNTNYPKIKFDPETTAATLQEMLPNADPDYIRQQAATFCDRPEAELKKFVENAIEENDYPTMEEYLKRKKHEQIVATYTTAFTIDKFLHEIPDPQTYFSNPDRKMALHSIEDEDQRSNDERYALTFLKNQYNFVRGKDIEMLFRYFKANLFPVTTKLERMPKQMKMPRKVQSMPETNNIPLIQEICYLKNMKEINKTLKLKDSDYQRAKKEAKRYNLFQTCACCYDDELLPEEVLFCTEACIFCKNCIKRGSEVVIAEGKLEFPCFVPECEGEFNIVTLQMVLNPKTFSRMAQRKQYADIKKANIDGLESCPNCEFATIPNPDDKIFKCQNSECLAETCRECGHKAHIPLRCNEIEYDEDVKMRVYIENKMTEALVRKCWSCSKIFIKESGCNKMTCSCGALMCYVCGQKVTSYSHFGNGNPCPLYTDNLNRFHADAVLKSAQRAKDELGVTVDPKKLKFDPTLDVKQHYKI